MEYQGYHTTDRNEQSQTQKFDLCPSPLELADGISGVADHACVVSIESHEAVRDFYGRGFLDPTALAESFTKLLVGRSRFT